jgi:hypothetical protein
MRCPFCTNSVIIPDELRAGNAGGGAASPNFFGDLTGKAVKFKELGELVRSGHKIAAIKLYRELFGCGLKEAKDAVENLAQGRPAVVQTAYGAQGGYEVNAQQFPPAAHSPFGQQPPARSGAVWVVVPVILILITVGVIFAVKFSRSNPGAASGSTHDGSPRVRGAVGAPGAKAEPGFASETMRFGSEGIGVGQFKDARSIGIDGSGNIYVGEYMGGRVQVFDAQGKFVTQWMVDAKMPLTGLAADRKGTVYIVQSGTISRYEGATGKLLGQLPYAGGNGFDDIKTTPDGGLIAAWYGNRDDIVRFDSNGQAGKIIRAAISGQSGDSELDTHVAADGLGNIYAFGSFNKAIFKFTRDGKFITRIGGDGDELGLFRAPLAIAVDGQGRIYASDIKGIQVFDTNGRYLDLIKTGGVSFGMVFNDKDELFIAARTQVIKMAINGSK